VRKSHRFPGPGAGALAVVVADDGRCADLDQYCVPGADRSRGEGFGRLDLPRPWADVHVPFVLILSDDAANILRDFPTTDGAGAVLHHDAHRSQGDAAAPAARAAAPAAGDGRGHRKTEGRAPDAPRKARAPEADAYGAPPADADDAVIDLDAPGSGEL